MFLHFSWRPLDWRKEIRNLNPSDLYLPEHIYRLAVSSDIFRVPTSDAYLCQSPDDKRQAGRWTPLLMQARNVSSNLFNGLLLMAVIKINQVKPSPLRREKTENRIRARDVVGGGGYDSTSPLCSRSFIFIYPDKTATATRLPSFWHSPTKNRCPWGSI